MREVLAWRVHPEEGTRCVSASGTAAWMAVAQVSLSSSLTPGSLGWDQRVCLCWTLWSGFSFLSVFPHKPYQRGKTKKQNVMIEIILLLQVRVRDTARTGCGGHSAGVGVGVGAGQGAALRLALNTVPWKTFLVSF